MNKKIVYLLSGIMGSGKDTFLKDHGLDLFSISMDEIRKLYTNPLFMTDGSFTVNNAQNTMVYAKFKEILQSKMLEGGLIIVNNMNINMSDIKGIRELSKKMNYEISIIDFPLLELDHYLKINNDRNEFKKINETFIVKSYEQKKKLSIPKEIEVLSQKEFLTRINKTYEEEIKDVSHYNKIHFFGDLQGCAKNMMDYLKNNGGKNDLFVFLGDYFDRGIENGEVIQFLEKTKDMNNFIFIKGNHDENLYRYYIKNEFENINISSLFIDKTLPQIKEVGLSSPIKMIEIYNNMEDYMFLKYHDKVIFVNHAGLTNIPKKMAFMSRYNLQNGDGDFNYDVDEEYSKKEEYKDIIQIHGHRNKNERNVINKNIINLEGAVEYGESLRVLEVSNNNGEIIMKPYELKNNKYEKGLLKYGEIEIEFNPIVPLVYQEKMKYENNLELISELRNNELITETVSEDIKHISSFNFTKKAFHDKKENHFKNEGVSHSRGLFINNETGEIISRGFEKFFNTNEKEETKLDKIHENFKFPLQLYKKENGFFATIGYDSKNDELIFTSKSRIEGEYPSIFKELVLKTFSEKELSILKRYAQKYNVCYVFEAIDLDKDPHIIKYEENKIILLSIIKRDFSYQDVEYNSLKNFTKQFKNLSCKEKLMKFNDEKSFNNFIVSLNNGNKFLYEGFVAEDQDGKKFKIKTSFYNGWKLVRNSIENHNIRYRKIEKLIEASTRETIINERKEELRKINSNSMARFVSNLNNLQILNVEFRKELIHFFKEEIKNPNKEFNQIYFYKKREEFINSKENNLILNDNIINKKFKR